jgi:L-ribulokinase
MGGCRTHWIENPSDWVGKAFVRGDGSMREQFVIGIDFGTESGRAVLVDVRSGKEVAHHVTPYRHGVISERLPESDVLLKPDAYLQHPDDYLEVLETSVPSVLQQAGIKPESVVGLGIDFTSSTMVPVDRQLVPLCRKPEWNRHPHAWVKLWKHHGPKAEAEKIDRIAKERGEPWLSRYGGKVSSEWMIPKCLEILGEAPEVYHAADLFLEAADWVVALMTGEVKRNLCAAGFKSFWSKSDGYPSEDFFAALDPRFADITRTKLRGEICPVGERAGWLTPAMAERMGLRPGLPVAVGIVDAHASVLGAGAVDPGEMLLVMGTSTCHMLISDEEYEVEGISGVVEDGILPGMYAYEAGQPAVGDLFAWFIKQGVPEYVQREAQSEGMTVFQWLEQRAAQLRPGESGLLALDWFNGNRSILDNAHLSGLIIGYTLGTRPEEIFRALMEATAFGTRMIIDAYRASGLGVNQLVACGGLPQSNQLLMQIYADVTGMEIAVVSSKHTSAVGAAILGSVAAGSAEGGYDSIPEAVRRLACPRVKKFQPIPEQEKVYQRLFREYKILHDYFGRGGNDVMKRLKQIREEAGFSASGDHR